MLLLRRLGRRLFWPWPAFYATLGFLKRGLNVLEDGYQLYIDGYPRSGNTFALKAFLLANPGTRVRSHRHIPTFIMLSIQRNEPGMVLIRKPVDAAVSWAIHQREPLLPALAYYNDYHSVLLRRREQLFFVSFEAATTDFGAVIRSFNEHWGASYAPFDHTPQNVAICLVSIETDCAGRTGEALERGVARPSVWRKPLQEKLLRELNSSPAAQKELRRANELYQMLAPKSFSPKVRPKMAKTTQSLRCLPGSS